MYPWGADFVAVMRTWVASGFGGEAALNYTWVAWGVMGGPLGARLCRCNAYMERVGVFLGPPWSRSSRCNAYVGRVGVFWEVPWEAETSLYCVGARLAVL